MNKRVVIIVLITIVLVSVVALYFCSDQYYSKMLIEAIKKQDIVAVEQILKEKPTCVNTVPTFLPKWFHIIIDSQRPVCALYVACTMDNVEIIKLLLDAGANVDGEEGVVPLSGIYLNKKDNWYIASCLLIEYGASLDYTTHYSGMSSSILHDILTVRSGSALPGREPENTEEVHKAFYYAIENCDHSNVDWMWVLQHSVTNDRVEIVKYLLEEDFCSVNDDLSGGYTALMFAAKNSNCEMVKFLLDYGADKSCINELGKTALDYAIEYNSEDVVELLKT